MLSIRLITAGGEDYYVNLAAEDYYLAGGEPPGKWCGAGAAALKLTGTVDAKAFRRVFRGYHPSSGEPMVQNAGHSDRQCAWDFTFSAPKSVSIVWSVLSAVVRLLIQKFQQMAVEASSSASRSIRVCADGWKVLYSHALRSVEGRGSCRGQFRGAFFGLGRGEGEGRPQDAVTHHH